MLYKCWFWDVQGSHWFPFIFLQYKHHTLQTLELLLARVIISPRSFFLSALYYHYILIQLNFAKKKKKNQTKQTECSLSGFTQLCVLQVAFPWWQPSHDIEATVYQFKQGFIISKGRALKNVPDQEVSAYNQKYDGCRLCLLSSVGLQTGAESSALWLGSAYRWQKYR